MAIRNIIKQGDPILKKVCRSVDKFDNRLSLILDDMAETLKEADGVGLAAPQVGIRKRYFIVDTGEKIVDFINPEIIETRGTQEEMEGCLSCPYDYGITKRPKWVKIKAFNRYGEEFIMEGSDLLARAFCHELDHLNGILFKERAIKMLNEQELKRYRNKNKK